MKSTLLLLAAACLLLFPGCDDKADRASRPAPTSNSTPPAAQPGESASNGDPTLGRQLFVSRCAACHGSDAKGTGLSGTRLLGVMDRYSEQTVRDTIVRGRGMMPPNRDLGEESRKAELDGLIAWLRMQSDAGGLP